MAAAEDESPDWTDVSENAPELLKQYKRLLTGSDVSWQVRYQLSRRLGSGGQGVVYLARRLGSHGMCVNVALKFFSPEKYPNLDAYNSDMKRIAEVTSCITEVQQDHLLDIHNFVNAQGIQVMVMEYVDGVDLGQLLSMRLDEIRPRMSERRWEYINDVVVTPGEDQLRVKPGIAIAILRDSLAALAAIHSLNILHGDIKPSNIMLKRTGNAKVIDLGSSFRLTELPIRQTWTPRYAACEVLSKGRFSESSDLASLGYVLLEMLSGRSLFRGSSDLKEILRMKEELPQNLDALLPEDVHCNELLMVLIRDLISVNPDRRGSGARAAQLADNDAAQIQRQLVLGDLASEYDSEIRSWLADFEDWNTDRTESRDAEATPSFFVQTSGLQMMPPSHTTRRHPGIDGGSL